MVTEVRLPHPRHEVKVNDKGTRMAKAQCPVCGTNLNRILGKA